MLILKFLLELDLLFKKCCHYYYYLIYEVGVVTIIGLRLTLYGENFLIMLLLFLLSSFLFLL